MAFQTNSRGEVRRDRIRDPEKAALLRRIGVPQQMIGPVPPAGWRVDWGPGRPAVFDEQGREVPGFALMLTERVVDIDRAQRAGIALSRWPREDPEALAEWLARAEGDNSPAD